MASSSSLEEDPVGSYITQPAQTAVAFEQHCRRRSEFDSTNSFAYEVAVPCATSMRLCKLLLRKPASQVTYPGCTLNLPSFRMRGARRNEQLSR